MKTNYTVLGHNKLALTIKMLVMTTINIWNWLKNLKKWQNGTPIFVSYITLPSVFLLLWKIVTGEEKNGCYNLRCWKLVSLQPQQWNLILSYCPVLLKFQNITAVLEIHFKMNIYRTWKQKSHQDPWQHFW